MRYKYILHLKHSNWLPMYLEEIMNGSECKRVLRKLALFFFFPPTNLCLENRYNIHKVNIMVRSRNKFVQYSCTEIDTVLMFKEFTLLVQIREDKEVVSTLQQHDYY